MQTKFIQNFYLWGINNYGNSDNCFFSALVVWIKIIHSRKWHVYSTWTCWIISAQSLESCVFPRTAMLFTLRVELLYFLVQTKREYPKFYITNKSHRCKAYCVLPTNYDDTYKIYEASSLMHYFFPLGTPRILAVGQNENTAPLNMTLFQYLYSI